MKQVGELLKKTREQKNLSLHEVGMSLKISPRTLQAIEAGDESKLPQKAFVRGFVKSYAQHLKLNASEVLNLMDKEAIEQQQKPQEAAPSAVIEKAVPQIAVDNKTTEDSAVAISTPIAQTSSSNSLLTRAMNPVEKPHPFFNTNSLVAFLVGLIVIASVVLITRLVNKYQKERGSEVAKLELLKSQELPTTSASSIISSEAPSTEPQINSNKTEILSQPEKTTAAVVPALGSGESTGAPISTMTQAKPPQHTERQTQEKATPRAEKTSPQQKNTQAEKAPAPPQKSTQNAATTQTTTELATTASASSAAIAVSKPQEVIIEALDNVTIQFKLGTERTEALELTADQMHTLKSKSSIDLNISNGGAVNIIVNGRDRGVPGQVGKPLHLTYPK